VPVARLVDHIPISCGTLDAARHPHLADVASKPDKLRVVFDCASRFMGKSLNERLGPVLSVLLPGCADLFQISSKQ